MPGSLLEILLNPQKTGGLKTMLALRTALEARGCENCLYAWQFIRDIAQPAEDRGTKNNASLADGA